MVKGLVGEVHIILYIFHLNFFRTSLFHLEDYKSAKDAFTQGQTLDRKYCNHSNIFSEFDIPVNGTSFLLN